MGTGARRVDLEPTKERWGMSVLPELVKLELVQDLVRLAPVQRYLYQPKIALTPCTDRSAARVSVSR